MADEPGIEKAMHRERWMKLFIYAILCFGILISLFAISYKPSSNKSAAEKHLGPK